MSKNNDETYLRLEGVKEVNDKRIVADSIAAKTLPNNQND